MSDKGDDWVVDGSEIDPEEHKRYLASLGNIAHRYPINHELWDKMADMSDEGATLYSFGIDPDAIKSEWKSPEHSNLDRLPKDYKTRLRIIKSAVRAGTIERAKVNGSDPGEYDDDTRILIDSFRKWCKAKPGRCKPAEVIADYPRYQTETRPAAHDCTEPSEKLSTRERNTLLKIIIGMAIKGYGYNPADPRSDITGEKPGSICADLGELGISVDVDTIRKYLKEAKELLPPQKT